MGNEKFNALLFDTRSIQKYIYSGNLLRTNIGASYIVDRIFFDILVDTLQKIFPNENFDYAKDTTWKISEDDKNYWEKMKSCCVAYIGGGNALILFKEDRRREVVKNFTMKLLETRPGLKVGVAFGELNIFDGKINQDDMSALYTKLKENQNNIFPAVNVPYSGLTLSCEINGEAANFCDTQGLVKPTAEIRFYSQETAVKAQMSDAANKTKNLSERFNKIFNVKQIAVRMDEFIFPTKVDELGQKDGENYFAIIHADGNNMGVKFRGCKNLMERRRLSREIRRKTEGAFAELLLKIIAAKTEGIFDEILDLKNKKILPIRPLILGGDDVTFICPAKMAILFTKTLMEILDAETPENAPENLTQAAARKMDCCAGVAILPTAYPFFRGYELAEQLCDAAKESMRLQKEPSSWLDFAILHGEQAPTLEQIRQREYTGARGNLHFGPYRIGNEAAKNKVNRRYNIENLLSCATQFAYMPQGKVKELRGILQRGKSDAKKFLNQLDVQEKILPVVPDWADYLVDALWSAETPPRTPYVDAIEIIDFYSPEVAEKWQNLT